MKYKCIKGFTLEDEISHGKFNYGKFKCERDSIWYWKREDGDMICVENYPRIDDKFDRHHVELIVDRADFVVRFEAINNGR